MTAREKAARNENPESLALQGVRALGTDWLGVRDDFRNWLIRAA
jgi:hypothetical protein